MDPYEYVAQRVYKWNQMDPLVTFVKKKKEKKENAFQTGGPCN